MKNFSIQKQNVFFSNQYFKLVFLFFFSFLLLQSCHKDDISTESDSNELTSKNSFLKSSLPDPYIKGEDIPEILSSIDEYMKKGDLEERNSSQLPFKFIGYDKSRAYKVYNDSFEITSYAFLAYTDIKDLNKVVNVVVTQKKNGKPGKPYLYEYTQQKVPNQIVPHLTKIVKYKINGVKVDLPGGNFNPCIDVICNQYNNPIGSSGTSGTGGSSGGGSGGTGGTSGTGGTGSIFPSSGTGGITTITCVKHRSIHNAQDGGRGYYEVVDTWCNDGTFTRVITYHLNIVLTDCCDSENVSIGVNSGNASGLSASVKSYLSLSRNALVKTKVDQFLSKYQYSQEATQHVNNQIQNMMNDSQYESLVVSSFNFSPIMWSIANELIGDKAVDVILKLVPGFREAQKLKDAIKAAKNNDWLEFTLEVGKIVAGTTPAGQLLKIGEAGSEMYVFCKQVNKIYDNIKDWTSTKTTQIWNIVKKNIKIASNPDYWKYVDNLASPKFGSYFATSSTYNVNFKNKFSEVKDKIVEVHHAVPREIEYGFGLISNSEINSLENLRGMPSREFHQIITEKWRIWLKPYKDTNTKPSIQFLLNKAKEIDDTYGANFIPPVR